MAGSMTHALVPFHEVLTDEEARRELAPYNIVDADGNIRLSALPPIPMDDPALLSASINRPAGASSSWPLDKIVRIERRSVFAGISVAYRVVSSVSAFPAAWKGRKRADQLGIRDVEEKGLTLVLDDEGLEAFDVQGTDDFTELDQGEVGEEFKDVIIQEEE